MTREEYIKLFHKEQLNLVAFKRLLDCDEEVLRLVNSAIETEREACAKIVDVQNMASKSTYKEQLETKDEPVGWIDNKGYMICVKTDESCRPLYTTPHTWVGLTQEEFEKLINDAGFTCSDLLMMGACIEKIVDLVEAKLKERNT